MTHGTCYFEFQKGTFRNEFWKDDSLLLHMNIFDRLDLSSVFTATIPDFDYYGVTHVAPEQYAALKATVQTKMMKLRHFFPSWIFGQPNALKYTTAFGYSQRKTVILSESDNVAVMSYPATQYKNYTVEFELLDSNGQKIAGQKISF